MFIFLILIRFGYPCQCLIEKLGVVDEILCIGIPYRLYSTFRLCYPCQMSGDSYTHRSSLVKIQSYKDIIPIQRELKPMGLR